MADPKVIVNKMLEGVDDPEPYLNWLVQKVDTGPLRDIRFGAYIHTSDEDTIRTNASEAPDANVNVDSDEFWEDIERNMAIIEANALRILRESGLHVSDEGHDDTARVASVWIDSPEEDRSLALLKAVINWAEGDWPSTTSGTMDYAFGANTTAALYANTTEAARWIDVTIEFSGVDALIEWSRLNLSEAIKGDPDDPNVFLKSYVPRMQGRLLIEFNVIKPSFPDAPNNWYRENVDGIDLFKYNRPIEMRSAMYQMRAYNHMRKGGRGGGIDQVTYRYKVPNPSGNSIVRQWLDKLGCPVPIQQWACETNAPISFWIPVREFNAYMKMVHPQVKVDEAVDVDDPGSFVKNYQQLWYTLYGNSQPGPPGAYIGTYHTISDALDAVRERKRSRKTTFHVPIWWKFFWIEEVHQPDSDPGMLVSTEPTGVIYDVTKDYQAVRRVSEAVDVDDPEAFVRNFKSWVNTFISGGMTSDDSEGHEGQFWKKWRLAGYNYWIMVGTRQPLWMQVQKNCALYGTNLMQQTYEFRDPNLMVKWFNIVDKAINDRVRHERDRRDVATRLDSELTAYHTEYKQGQDRLRESLGSVTYEETDAAALEKAGVVVDFGDNAWGDCARHGDPYLIKLDGQPVGWFQLTDQNELNVIEVLPAYQKRGIGTEVVRQLYGDQPDAAALTHTPASKAGAALLRRFGINDPEVYEATDESTGQEFVDNDVGGYVSQIYDYADIASGLELLGLNLNHAEPWGHWLVLTGHHPADDNPENFRKRIEDYLAQHHITLFRVQITHTLPERTYYKLAIHRSQLIPDTVPGTPDNIKDHSAWLPEGKHAKVYVRFGDIPADEISRHGGAVPLKGVSVYPAIQYEDRVCISTEVLKDPHCYNDLKHLFGNRPAYLVTGNEVGTGTTWEPLLKNVKVVRKLDDKELIIPRVTESVADDLDPKADSLRLMAHAPMKYNDLRSWRPYIHVPRDNFHNRENYYFTTFIVPVFTATGRLSKAHSYLGWLRMKQFTYDNPPTWEQRVAAVRALLPGKLPGFYPEKLKKRGFQVGEPYEPYDGRFYALGEAKQQHRIAVGGNYWFEYRCLEAAHSAHAHLWYRSHQRVKVLALEEPGIGADEDQRAAEGCPAAYRVRFKDGLEETAMEDELLETPDQFTRPDPPKAPVGEAVDPDDPSVNIDRHIAAMDAGTILTGLGFDERKPSWNCADPEYKWWERFVGSQKWTVIRKSDDEPQMFEISVYAPRKLTTPHGSLTDYEQVAGETLHVGKLEAKLRMALGEGLDDPDPKEYLDQITGWIDQLTALGFTPEKFQPGTYNKTVENERLAFHAYLTTKKLSATVEREVYGGSAMGRMFAHSPYRLLFGFRDQAAFLQFVQELNAKLEEFAKTKPSHRAGFMLMLALDKMYAQHQGRKAQRVGEALGVPDPDAPEANIERFAQHIEKKEQEWIDSAILNATTEFDQVISRRGITDFRLADELAASLGDKWANTAGYPNGSDEYDIVVSAVNNHASEQFPEGFDPASLGVDLPEAVEDIDPKAYLQQLPIPVRAKIVADRDRVMAEFDANAWFEQASIGELVELAKCEFQSDYPADAVGEFFFDTSLKEWHTAYTGDGFEVYVDESDAQRWVEHNRREWYPMLWPNDMPIKEAADPDDPSAFIQHMETDWREILRKYGWTGDEHYTFTLKFPDRVWGPNWPVNIFAHHGWEPRPEFDYIHPDPDNPDIDAEDDAFERWLVDHPLGRREIEFPDYIAFQFGRESYRRIEVPLAKLASFCSRLVAGAKKVVGTETVASVHQGHGLSDMLWTLGTEIARDLQIPLKESVEVIRVRDRSVDDIPKERLTHMARSGNCPELCACGAYCTLIHHRLLPDGRPAYHICQTCDSKTADVAENLNVDDPTKELLHAAFDVPAMLQRRGYEKSGSEQAWYRVFRREPTDLDLMIEVKRRGMGGEASEGDIVYDITLYDYPVHENPEKHWRPFVYRYARNNAQIERVLKILEARIRANNLRGVRNDESLPVAPVPPEDDPEQVIKSHEKGLLLPELERLGFTPRREQGVETLYGEDIQRYWYKTYRAPDGKGHALSVFFFGGQTPEVYASTYNFDTKVWIKGDERPNSPAQSQAGFSAIIRDLDDAMQRSTAVSLPFDQETEMMRRVMAHHRRWWDDTLDYLVRQGGIPGRMGPGQPA